MTQADRIRDHVLKKIIGPARAKGLTTLMVRAGDIHDRMKLFNSHPAVCSALGGSKLVALAGVTVVNREGPPNGANAYFQFDLRASSHATVKPASTSKAGREIGQPLKVSNFDLTDALVLVSCTKAKRPGRMAARDLYGSSNAFSKKRTLIERSKAQWMILSAKHGLLDPNTQIDNYDQTLKMMTARERREWANLVLKKLIPLAAKFDRVVIFAGQAYSQYLVPELRDVGCEVLEPLAGLTQGRQLAWLARHR